MDEDENLEWINANGAGRAEVRSKASPKIDKEITDVVGVAIYVNDPRLIRLVTKWKRAKNDPDATDEFLKDGAKIIELRRVFNPERFGLEPMKI